MFRMLSMPSFTSLFFFKDTATTEIYTLSLHDALPILGGSVRTEYGKLLVMQLIDVQRAHKERSEEHTSELQSRLHLVCRLLLEKKKTRSAPMSPTSSGRRSGLTYCNG